MLVLTPRETPRRIDGKGSLGAVWQSRITLTNVSTPKGNRLPHANSFNDRTGRQRLVRHRGLLRPPVGARAANPEGADEKSSHAALIGTT